MLTPDSLARLRAVNIVDVVGKYMQLKKHGPSYSGCCPFHNEKTPSFSVNPVKGIFKCFGCGRGGDAISFVREHEKLDFIEAADVIADLCGLGTLEREKNFDNEAYQQKKEERKGLQQLMDECAARYIALLWKDGCPGMEYLTGQRGYDEDTISYWQLGFAPDANTVNQHYHATGNLPALVKLGLVAEGENHHYDAFRNRVLFPIMNERGEVVSFGGRILGDGKPKYLNTTTTELYDKSRTLYGLYQASAGIKESRFVTIAEGYTDVISLHRAGLTNAVATCGTALTGEQCLLLKRYTDRILLIRDGDAAGLKATSRDIALLVQYGFAVDVLPMEEGKDPDDFAKQFVQVMEEETV